MGLMLIVLGLAILAYSIYQIEINEFIVSSQNLPFEHWNYSYLQWWKTITSVIIFPATFILIFVGTLIILGSKFELPGLKYYLKTKNARWYWVILVLTITTMLIVHIIPENFYPLVYLRHVFGAVFILWLPGYSFIRVIFIDRKETKAAKPLYSVENIGLIICSNLGIIPITGLLLNYSPLGIGLTSIIFGLLSITMFFSTLALLLDYRADYNNWH
jgi:hypothetical protein